MEHTPHRPSWDCQACGKDWPCDPAREHLSAEYAGQGASLATYLWIQLEDYARDCGAGPLAGAFDRFIAWSRAVRK